jgi:D-alanyl-D-alanine carboxypeptidase
MEDLARTAKIDSLIQEQLDAAGAPGAAIALSLDGDVWSAGVGHTDLERCTPMPAGARFSIYSITKTIIATILVRLVEDRALTLDDPIQDFLLELPIETPVSIRQVLNHTGGFPDYGGLPEYHAAVREHPGEPWSPADFLAHTLGDDLEYMPGHGWRYSNLGYMLLRQVLEDEAGFPFKAVVRHYLTLPFGLHDIVVVDSLEDVAVLTPGFSTTLDGGETVANVAHRYAPGWVAHGLASSTAADLARFFDLLFAESLWEPPLLNEMLMPVPVTTTHPWMKSPSYGLGLMMDPANRFGKVAGHTGGGPGYSTAAYHFPDVHGHRLSSVALVNRDGSDVATDIVFSMVERIAEAMS